MSKTPTLAGRWDGRRASLYNLIRSCLERNEPSEVNLSVPRHSVTAPVLRTFAYDQTWRDRAIPIVFADHSRPRPFPIGRLEPGEPPPIESEEDVIKLGLGSFRHPELDYLVDLYVVRNRELSDELTMASAEELSYRRTVELLDDPALREGGRLWVYHTGLEPMVIGFYRGIVEILKARSRARLPRTLIVRPWLFDRPPDHGPFTRDSPGAQPSSFISCEPWW